MKILGIDPALSSLGWGIIETNSSKLKYIDSGIVKTNTQLTIHKRLAKITNSIEILLETHNPDIIGMEETFINVNAKSSLKLAYVRGALMSVIGKHSKDFYEFTPNQIKKSIVGSGHAEKNQVIHMVKLIISGTKDSITNDEADALAVAYSCSLKGSSIKSKL